MTRLTMEQISQETDNSEASSVNSLQLSHRAFSDVSSLNSFKNLERLDLSYNCLTSLEGLSSCINLKWLQVSENKLSTLKGIEYLIKLTVLNACRNKLEKMDEICALSNLRALILNDNNIASICKLDQMKYLNTLVLSRNPLHTIGNSLKKVPSLTKLSLSHCKLQTIGSSLVGCVNLKEVRFSHNDITALPEEFAKNVKLRNLDVGNNLIEKLSDVKVLSTLHNLKNLNIIGNPIAENNKLTKVKRLLPNLRVFNSKPFNSDANSTKNSLVPTKVQSTREIAYDFEDDKKRTNASFEAEASIERKKKVMRPSKNCNESDISAHKKTDVKGTKKKSKSDAEMDEFKDINDVDEPFVNLIFSGKKTNEDLQRVKGRETLHEAKLVQHGAKKMKCSKNMGSGPSDLQSLFSKHEIGMGGQSTWDG